MMVQAVAKKGKRNGFRFNIPFFLTLINDVEINLLSESMTLDSIHTTTYNLIFTAILNPFSSSNSVRFGRCL